MHQGPCTRKFKAELFIIAKSWKHPKCPRQDGPNIVDVYNGLLYACESGWTQCYTNITSQEIEYSIIPVSEMSNISKTRQFVGLKIKKKEKRREW